MRESGSAMFLPPFIAALPAWPPRRAAIPVLNRPQRAAKHLGLKPDGASAVKELEMEAAKNVGMTPNRGSQRMAADLLWFAAASLGAGLMAAIAAAALVMLLA